MVSRVSLPSGAMTGPGQGEARGTSSSARHPTRFQVLPQELWVQGGPGRASEGTLFARRTPLRRLRRRACTLRPCLLDPALPTPIHFPLPHSPFPRYLPVHSHYPHYAHATRPLLTLNIEPSIQLLWEMRLSYDAPWHLAHPLPHPPHPFARFSSRLLTSPTLKLNLYRPPSTLPNTPADGYVCLPIYHSQGLPFSLDRTNPRTLPLTLPLIHYLQPWRGAHSPPFSPSKTVPSRVQDCALHPPRSPCRSPVQRPPHPPLPPTPSPAAVSCRPLNS